MHVVFDNPGRQSRSPKAFERRRRDNIGTLPSDHWHVDFTDASTIPSAWREHLLCRACKRRLVVYLGQAFQNHIPGKLRSSQKLVLAGCYEGHAEDQAWEVTTSDCQPNPVLSSSAEEADTRVWLHVLHSAGMRKLVYSPDTDVYHIGLPVVCSTGHDVYVQLSTLTSPDVRLLHLRTLCSSLAHDPDLASTPETIRPSLLQSLFICTGCDYISFFAGIGKASFLRVFFQHSSFVNANCSDYPGHLSNTRSDDLQLGFLAFVRLVGSAYFKKCQSAFVHDSPRALLNSCQQSSVEQSHKHWLETIRDTVWERIEFEDELPPSWEALNRHWLRSCWVSDLWSQATVNHYNLLPLSEYGWFVNGDDLTIDWDDPANIQKVQTEVQLLLKGCSCKKGCKTRRCGCVKEGRKCGPGCNCRNCENIPTAGVTSRLASESEVEMEESQEELRNEYDNELVENIDDDDYDEVQEEDIELEVVYGDFDEEVGYVFN